MGRHKLGFTDIHHAAYAGDLRKLKALLQAGGDPNARSKFGYAPLHSAAEGDQAESCRILLAAGALLDDAENAMSASALHHAAMCGSADACEALLAAGASLDMPDKSGETPLGLAWRTHETVRGNDSVIALLQSVIEKKALDAALDEPAPKPIRQPKARPGRSL